MRNLFHPNWSGKPYRSRDEAFGGRYVAPKKDPGNHPGYWVLAVILIGALAVLGFAPLDSKAQTIDYVQRSLNKTIVVEQGRTTSIPQSSGGISVVTPRKETRRSFSSPRAYKGDFILLCRGNTQRDRSKERICGSNDIN